MVEGAARLLATKGVEGTSFAEVLAATDAPRGSVYHHFPGGKAELVHAALDFASERGLAAMETARGQPAAAVVEKFLELWRGMLRYSKVSAGCAVLAVTTGADDAALLDHAGAIFRAWTDHVTELLVAGGTKRQAAAQLAVTLVAATEGAVAMSRSQRSLEPFDQVAAVLRRLAS